MMPTRLEKKEAKIFEKIPKVQLFKQDIGGHVSRGLISPKLYIDWSPPSDFQLIPVDKEGNIICKIDVSSFASRADYFRALRMDRNWANVAIRCCETGSFMSCRRSTYIPSAGWTCLTEYRTSVGEFEQFKLQFHPTSGAFTFKTHNNCYLDANRTFSTLVCRPAPTNEKGWLETSETNKTIASDRSWLISPKLKTSSSQERILFIGAYDETSILWNREMELYAEGELLVDNAKSCLLSNDYLNLLRKWMQEFAPKHFPRGGWTHWTKNDKFHHYLRLQANEEQEEVSFQSFVSIITTKNFSRSLCLECMNELMEIHLKYSKEATNKYLEKYKMRRDEAIRSELHHLMWTYDQFNEEAPLNKVLNEALQGIEKNMEKLNENIATAEDILVAAAELEEQCKLFRKRTKSLRKMTTMSWKDDWLDKSLIMVGGGIGMTAGALFGLLIGLLGGLGLTVPYYVCRKILTMYQPPPIREDMDESELDYAVLFN
ncbi:hypothetical protein CTEN210_13299 [Chaetoceros tenuissimus]|uniref:Uncharacterized protein n=1 Tax=Chaetoceros tenuissimus TaxID=426638 RepID=A0AAD3HBB0_9STRA|nr:hypothetical protein CTEN210_13299 [Chaetoceros tenuissimus]